MYWLPLMSTRSFSYVYPIKRKSQCARLLGLLIQRLNVQVRLAGETGVKRLHTDKGGEFCV